MIFRASIGDVTALLDDEITDERPTPEHARDYLRACSDETLRLFSALPDAEPAATDTEA